MSREVRRVPMDWQHPMEWREQWDQHKRRMRQQMVPKSLLDGSFAEALADFKDNPADYDDREPDPADYMPEFDGDPETFGYAMYETVSEGTPISPTFDTPEALAHWLVDTGASAFGEMTATYEQWLAVARGGWAPSAVVTQGGPLKSGVEFIGDQTLRKQALADIAAELGVNP